MSFNKNFSVLNCFCLAVSLFPINSLWAQTEKTIEEMVVTADFYETSALMIPSSVTLFDEQAITKRNAENLEDLFGLAANVNYATGASRGRFIQIRGIGERSEFIEPVNYSVGVLIDGIDFTGISTAATTLDIAQVEILRGPQGTLYGANALAGLINLVSKDPTDTTEADIEATLGNYGTQTLKGAIGGAINNQLGYRLAAQSTQSDGFTNNSYLGLQDTENIDETTFRGKLVFAVNTVLDLGLTLLYADIDNGYDAFNYDNNRQTLSNEPGHDRQETAAFALDTVWQLTDTLALEGLLSTADSDIEYGYDEDWRNPEFCIIEDCVFGPDGYHSAFDNYQRDNKNDSIDLRIKSNSIDESQSWVLGVYYRDQSVDLQRTYISGYGPASDILFSSNYNTENSALYADWSLALAESFRLSLGARYENRDADYRDSDTFGFSTSESLWGGRVSLSYELNDTQIAYATISRGYKPGGANSNASVPLEFREYDTETMVNYELGTKGLFMNGDLQAQIALFYQDRSDIQTDSAIVTPPSAGQPNYTFDDYLTNAANGDNYGLEAQFNYSVSDTTGLYATLGLLDATYGPGYINYQHVDADEENGIGVYMNGRDQPHAPAYQYVLGIDSDLTEQLNLNLNLEGQDDFLFSNDHNVRSDSYTLLNAGLTYELDNWSLSLWGKNLTDEDYQNRAFGSFPNDPRDGYATLGPYYQLNDARTYGLTGRYSF